MMEQGLFESGNQIIQYAMLSEKGSRDINEDYIGVMQSDNGLCLVLADGLGGHGGGDLASRLVGDEVLRGFSEWKNLSEETMRSCFERAQNTLLEAQRAHGRSFGMKSTLVIWMTDGEKYLYGHIGDSRLYEFEQGAYVRRTLDHSVPQMLALAGEIKESEIRGHTDRNRLLRAMGIEWGKKPYVLSSMQSVKEGQAFLLCSDGFWEWIEDETMTASLTESDNAEKWLEKMEQEVKTNGSVGKMDNYSAIVIQVR